MSCFISRNQIWVPALNHLTFNYFIMKKIYKFILCFAVLGVVFTSCNKEDQETASLSFSLVDAPGDYQEVNVDIQGLEVVIDGEIIKLDVEPRILNLLELTGGVSELLADGEFPVGQINQIRLILGDNNTLVVEGETESQRFDLQTPSGQQTGIKLVVAKNLEAGIRYDFILDFNVDKSVVALGAEAGYALKPVVRVTTKAESGAISGVVTAGEQTVITAASTTDTISSFANESTGEFLLYAVPAGEYKITVGETVTHEGVEVVTGETTDLGQIGI